MQYKVGQILYVILSKKGQVYPMRIIEEITKKTLRGQEVNYVLQAGSSMETTLLLSQVDGEVFDTADDARRALIDRATRQIEKIVDNAISKSKEWYGPDTRQEPKPEKKVVHELPPPIEHEAVIDEGEVITLPDGTKARLRSAVIG